MTLKNICRVKFNVFTDLHLQNASDMHNWKPMAVILTSPPLTLTGIADMLEKFLAIADYYLET